MVPSEKPGLVFQRRGRQRSDDHCPQCVVCPRAGTGSVVQEGGRRKLFSSPQTRRVVSEERESGRALRLAFPNTHAQRKHGALFAELKPRLNHSTSQKQAFQNKLD